MIAKVIGGFIESVKILIWANWPVMMSQSQAAYLLLMAERQRRALIELEAKFRVPKEQSYLAQIDEEVGQKDWSMYAVPKLPNPFDKGDQRS